MPKRNLEAFTIKELQQMCRDKGYKWKECRKPKDDIIFLLEQGRASPPKKKTLVISPKVDYNKMLVKDLIAICEKRGISFSKCNVTKEELVKLLKKKSKKK